MNIPDGHLFFVRRDLGDQPPKPELMRFLNPNNPFNLWRQGEAAPHTVENIGRVCYLYQSILPKYRIIHSRLQSEPLRVYNLTCKIGRYDRCSRKHRITQYQMAVHLANVSDLSDSKWSVAALEREEEAATDFLEALCLFIGVDKYDFDNDEFEFVDEE